MDGILGDGCLATIEGTGNAARTRRLTARGVQTRPSLIAMVDAATRSLTSSLSNRRLL